MRWLTDADKNTKFFHHTTLQKRQHNRIMTLQNNQGDCISTHNGIENMLNNHYSMLLHELVLDRETAIDKIVYHNPKLVTDDQNASLLQPITVNEVEVAVQDMPDGKSLGLDGFTVDLFHA